MRLSRGSIARPVETLQSVRSKLYRDWFTKVYNKKALLEEINTVTSTKKYTPRLLIGEVCYKKKFQFNLDRDNGKTNSKTNTPMSSHQVAYQKILPRFLCK